MYKVRIRLARERCEKYGPNRFDSSLNVVELRRPRVCACGVQPMCVVVVVVRVVVDDFIQIFVMHSSVFPQRYVPLPSYVLQSVSKLWKHSLDVPYDRHQ